MVINLPPAFILILGSFLIPFLKGRIKTIYLVVLPLLTFVYVLFLSEGVSWVLRAFDSELVFKRVDRLSLPFGYIFSLITLLTAIYSLHVKDNLHLVAGFIYAGSALGVVFAGDLVTLYIFWEIMALASTVVILTARTKKAISAGMRYLLVHLTGGLLLLGGIILWFKQTGSLRFEYIGLNSLASWLIFLGFGVNAAFPVLHAWLPDAYPESTETGTVFLSVFTTKTAVYVLARSFSGTELLIYIGALMVVFPIFYGIIENNLRRVLSYVIINQVGFMVIGIGIGTTLSLNGTIAHALCHILYDAVLFMALGAVLYRTGKINTTDLGGLYKYMPLTAIFCIIGAASISGFPLTSGFVSKSMIISAAGEGGLLIIWLALLLASAGVFLVAGIKVPYFSFFSYDSGLKPKEAPPHMLLAMGIAAFLCIGIGLFPGLFYSILPYPVAYHPYTPAHVIDQIQLLGFSALAFTLLVLSGLYPPEIRCINLDADWFYRKATSWFLTLAEKVVAKVDYQIIGEAYEKVFIRGMLRLANLSKKIDVSGVDGTYHALAKGSLQLSEIIKVIQTGKVSDYAFLMIIGLIALLLLLALPMLF
ncbi:Na(+)/H(+) antiporter subunit D [Thermodesulfobacterium sp. TA1]|uniref:Na(+)/H(+) antiporter subunit D n=1 Tax=Thermodesulfobacterium sp. TA1 TaxID=2234087 RepID=UPI001231E582|nr:Na(+)/H(+) antiporter subunit D [Thermodesulfobacterium sp. TA1]QER42643.1 Na(+)/H(+) antiporter subunit D [Thermodesulfobacterium sp. TA1]